MSKVDIQKVDKRKVQIIIGVLLIAIVNLWNLQSLHSITIVDDEFGYVGMAAQMAGYDWTTLLKTASFYSYGYGILLSLLFRAGLTSAALFRAAVVLNVVFLILSFLIACYLADKIIHNKHDILLALAITLYSCNIFQAKLSWSETILYFLTWLMVLLFYQLSVRFQFRYLVAVIVISVYMYTVHQRCLAIIVATVIMIGIILLNGHFNKKNVCKAAAAMLILLFLLILAGELKDWIITNWYQADSVLERRIAVNDYGGQVTKLKRLLEPKVFIGMLLGMAGKLWAQSVASGMLILLALVVSIWKVIKKRIFHLESEDIFAVTAALMFLGALGVATLYKLNNPGNYIYYTVIMTRYIDYVTGPMLLLGFQIIFDYKEHIKEIIMSIAIMLIITMSTYYTFTKASRTLMVNVNIVSVYPMIGDLSGGLQRVILAGIGTIIFIVIVLGIIKLGVSKNKENFMIFMVLFGILLMWSYNGLKASAGYTNHKQEEVREYTLPVVDYIENSGYEKMLYYVTDMEGLETGSYNFLKILQFLLPERKIELIADSEIEKVSKNGSIIILTNSEYYQEYDLSGIEDGFVMDTGRLRVYRKSGPVL